MAKAPGPLVLSQRGQQALHGGGDESPPALAGGSSLFTQPQCSWEDLATPPFLCLLSVPHRGPRAAPVTAGLLGPKHFPAAASPKGTDSFAFSLWQCSDPAEGLSVGDGSLAVKSRVASVGHSEG